MKTSPRKDIVITFQKLVLAGKVKEAYDKLVHPQFRHHNPYFSGDRQSLLTAMEENAKQFPNKVLTMQRIFEDGDFVIVHSQLQLQPDLPEQAVIHIFRFEGNYIVEEWDVSQTVPKEHKNENGMF